MSSHSTYPELVVTDEQLRWFAEEVQPHEPKLRARFPLLTDLDDLIQESYVRLIRARAFFWSGTRYNAGINLRY